MSKQKIVLILAFFILPPMAWMWYTASNDPTFIYNIIRWLQVVLPSFIVGTGVGGFVSYKITVIIMRKMYHRRVRRTNEYYNEVKRKTKILQSIDGVLFKLRNTTDLYTSTVKESSEKLLEIIETIKNE